MSKRAKRLADFLEKELDWNIYPSLRICPKCKTESDDKYCGKDGTKMALKEDRVHGGVLAELENAIKYALKKK